MKKILRYIIYVTISLIVALLLFIEIMTLTDYKPEPITILAQNNTAKPLPSDTVTILSWNIGYAGLDADMDFFYDGGQKTRTSKQQTKSNLKAICNFLTSNNCIDFVLLQEVDKKARRTYNINQLDAIAQALPNHILFFAKDYDVLFVPIPLLNPMGRVISGITTLAKHTPNECVQHAYPSQGKWPVRLFLLDNCFITTRYPLNNGKEFILVNTHNSAYDDGEKRMVEMNYLRQFLLNEYEKGNYVIAGGDWNQVPPLPDSAFKFDTQKSLSYTDYFNPLPISKDFMPYNWQWVSGGYATNRFLYEPYKETQTAETLIDFFLISPNVKCIGNKTIDLAYTHSDHKPIIGKFILSPI